MKKLILTLMAFLPLAVFAQGTSGVITYAEVIQTKWTPPADMDPAMKAQIEQMMKNAPKSITIYKDLSFNQEFAQYKISPKQEKIDAERAAQENMEGGVRPGGGMRRMWANAGGVHHWDLKKGKYVEKRTFFDKEFLIKDEPQKLQWKILGEAKQIAGYVCQKASTKIDTTVVTAWFCPTLPVSAGPAGYGQLPGMILEINTDERTTITAETIELKPIDEKDFEEPKSGKVVTKAEYDAIVKEKMDEMREEWKARMNSSGGGQQMRMMHGQ